MNAIQLLRDAKYTKQGVETPRRTFKFVPPTKKNILTVVDIIEKHPELKENKALMAVVSAYFESILQS